MTPARPTFAILLLLFGCSGPAAAPVIPGPAPEPTPEPTPEPAPVFTAVEYPPVVDGWWTDPKTHCPEGTKLSGGGPPDHDQAYCVVEGQHFDIRGPRTDFFSNGQKQSEGWYENGESVGVWRAWYRDGQLRHQVEWVAGGGQAGVHKQWGPGGRLINDYVIANATGEVVWKNERGEVAETGRVRLGKKVGTWTTRRDNGELRQTAEYRDGLRHGLVITYNERGSKTGEATYADGKQHGIDKRIDPSTGLVDVAIDYLEGERVRKVYYQNGKPLTEAPEPTTCDSDEGLSAALEAHDGRGLPDRHRCVSRSETFPQVVLVGSFAYDRGCRPRATFVMCQAAPLDSKRILELAGWSKADPKLRERIARDYLREVHTVFGNRIERGTLRARSDASGAVTVVVTVAEPAGMRPGRKRYTHKFKFAPDGALTAAAAPPKFP